ncbi:hypothetical protein UlMin_002940 [Ulmus minor]
MDWFSWLSKTGLEPPLIYEYGLAFSRNELQLEDLAYFNHEFLQSMGITVAKHRLEIIKLAKKENGGYPRSISRLLVAISKTKKSFGKYLTKLGFQEDMSSSSSKDLPEKTRYQEHWKGALLRKQRSEDLRVGEERPIFKTRSLALSGPLDGRVHERLMASNTRALKLSGPIDGRLQERLMYPNRSPKLSGVLDGRNPVPERMIIATRSPKLSGPLDSRVHDRFFVTSKSPKLSGPVDSRAVSPKFITPFEKDKEDVEYDEHSLWTALFQDMKPT